MVWAGGSLRTRPASPASGMLLVIGIVVFVAGITATAGTIAINGLGQSRQRIHFEQSLAAAESGIDYALGELQWAFDLSFADFPVPKSGGAPDRGLHGASGAAAHRCEHPDDVERAGLGRRAARAPWRLRRGRVAARVPPADPDGRCARPQAAERRPVAPGSSTGGCTPAAGPRGGATRRRWRRTVKVEYVFMPYQPQHAVLTGSNLELQGSYLVDEARGVPAATAGVHTNGSLTVDRQRWRRLRSRLLQRGQRARQDLLLRCRRRS